MVSCVCVLATDDASLMNFENTTVTIEGRHELVGGVVNNAPISFSLEAVTKDAPMPSDANGVQKTVDIKPGEQFSFGSIHYPTYGTYDYVVKRNIVPSENIQYDETVYTVHVSVMADGSVVTILENNATKTKVADIVYTDTYVEKPAGGTVSTPENTTPPVHQTSTSSSSDVNSSSNSGNTPTGTSQSDVTKRSAYQTGDFLPYILGGVLILLLFVIVGVARKRVSHKR